MEVISVTTKFRTIYDDFKVESKTGERIEPIYSAHYDEDGVLVLMQTGKRDVYDEIQSHKDSVDINVIMKRFQSGDTAVLNRVQGIYADYTGFPKDYQGILNTVVDAEQIFAALPVDVKNHFGNSFSKWLVAGGMIDFDYQAVVDSVRVPAEKELPDGKVESVSDVDKVESGDE